MKPLVEGWGFPGNSRKAHYFVDGLSLCGKWMFSGRLETTDYGVASPDDCVACSKKEAGRRPRPKPKPERCRCVAVDIPPELVATCECGHSVEEHERMVGQCNGEIPALEHKRSER